MNKKTISHGLMQQRASRGRSAQRYYDLTHGDPDPRAKLFGEQRGRCADCTSDMILSDSKIDKRSLLCASCFTAVREYDLAHTRATLKAV